MERNLTIIREVGKRVTPSGKTKIRVLCECSCGLLKEFDKESVASGHTKSCGCKHYVKQPKNIAGLRFGKLTAISVVGKSRDKQFVWNCLCDCGGETNATQGNLKSGYVKSCGCYITSEEYRQKASISRKGKLTGKSNHSWRDGQSLHRKALRKGYEYSKWRRSVFVRDNYTCQGCSKTGCYLEADHIKPFAYYPELRYELSNGRTLCAPCHRNTDTYAGRANKFLCDQR